MSNEVITTVKVQAAAGRSDELGKLSLIHI